MIKHQFHIRPFELGTHYPDICEWWRNRGWKGLPADALPANGLVASDDNAALAVIFIWFIESNWAWIDYLVTNPATSIRRRAAAIEFVIREAKKVAHSSGTERIITCLSNKNLITLHERLGFVPGDKGMTTMICNLSEGNI